MDLYPLVRPLLFALDAERAHGITIAALKRRSAPPAQATPPAGPLAVQLAGLAFPNPIGLAAGFDKNAEVFGAMLGLGFGFVEVGTLTPLAQAGNPRPRLFRLVEDRAVINRLGFNNRGQENARPRLARRQSGGAHAGIVGVNIGANKDSTDRIADYAAGVRRMAEVADYLTINISSPNTPGLRALQDEAALNDLLAAVVTARGECGSAPPLFLKVAPDLEPADIDSIAKAALDHRLDALIVSNTTISRPPLLSPNKGQAGGLSGAPLKPLALQRLRDFRTATGAGLPLVATGGVESGPDAYDRIRAGASLVQLYTALIYRGPGLVRTILAELEEYLAADGFTSVAEAVGTG